MGSEIRDVRYDFYKGLLMIGVVLGHVLTALQAGKGETVWIHEFIRTYDMPMFAFISGIFLAKSCRKRGPIKNILNKVGGVLVPAIIWSWLYALVGGRLLPSIGGLWFLYSIFFSSVVIILVDQIKNRMVQIGCFLLITIVFHTVIIDPCKIGFLLPPAICGYYHDDIVKIIEKKASQRNKQWLYFVMLVSFIVGQCFWRSDYSVWTLGCNLLKDGVYASNALGMLYRFSVGILGCILMERFFDILFNCLQSYTKSSKMLDVIILWGQSTMELYILHAWIVSVAGAKVISILVEKLGYNPFTFNERLLVLMIAPAVTIFALFFCYWVSVLIKKIPFIGKYSFSIKIALK